MLASLAQACQEVRTRLNQQIAGLEGQTPAVLKMPACEPETAVGALIGSLSGETEIAAVERLAALSADELARLATLRGALTADPVRMARQLQGIRSRLEAACQRIAATEAALCQDAATALVAAHQAHCAARQAVQSASATPFSGEPLPDVGSDVWRKLVAGRAGLFGAIGLSWSALPGHS